MKTLAALAFIAMSVSGQSARRSVYVLPMAGGLDQYLAQWISSGHAMRVVADPKIADVVLTDRLDAGFEQALVEMRSTDQKTDDKDDTRTHVPFRSSRARGTIFLVDAKSHTVLWSDYEKVSVSRSNDVLNQEAERIAKKLLATGL
jgi:hypothetical protein